MSISRFVRRGQRQSSISRIVNPKTREVIARYPARANRAFFSPQSPRAGGAVAASDAKPPMSNTGVHSSAGSLVGTAISPDWWSETIHADFEVVRALLETVGLGALDKLDGGSRFCKDMYVGLHGLRVESAPHDERQNWTAWSMPGACCHSLGANGIKALMDALRVLCIEQGVKCNCTRFDMAMDTQSFEAEWFARCTERDGKAAAVGRADREIERRSEAYHVERSEGGGCTTYLGAPTSDKRLVVYHKMDGDTFGAGVAFTRVEQRWRHEAAQAVYARFEGFPLEDWPTLAAGLLNDYATCCKRWWRSFVGTLEKAVLVVKRARSTIAQKRAWVERSVAPTLSVVLDGLDVALGVGRGWEWLVKSIQDGRERRSPVDVSRVKHNQVDGLPAFAVYGGAL